MKFSTAGIECYLQQLDEGDSPAYQIMKPLDPADPTVIEVGVSVIPNFAIGDPVTISGVTGTGWEIVNGSQIVFSVDPVAGTFTIDLDTSALTGQGVTTTATVRNDIVIPAASAMILAATNTKPVTLTVDDTSELVVGDMATITDTNSTLDNRTFIIEAISGTDVILRGSDLSNNTSIVTGGTLTVIPMSDMLRFCLSSYERAVEAADAIDVSTFCGAESLAGTPQPGTVSIEGFIDYSVEAYKEWLRGVADGQQRLFRITLPKGIGDIIMTITPSGVTETFEVNEAAAFSGEAVINQQPVYMV